MMKIQESQLRMVVENGDAFVWVLNSTLNLDKNLNKSTLKDFTNRYALQFTRRINFFVKWVSRPSTDSNGKKQFQEKNINSAKSNHKISFVQMILKSARTKITRGQLF